MKYTILFVVSFLNYIVSIQAQKKYWQQEVNYTIKVSLSDINHTLDGFETIEYVNNSDDTLFYIWFHLWPNAYKNDKTIFNDQLLKMGNTDFYFSTSDKKGYINQLNFKINGTHAAVVPDSLRIDIVKVILPTPLLPKSSINISTPFRVKLPYNFSRGGHTGQDFQITQWYPKPAVYDYKGWHPMSYTDQGEFYSNFGNYNVEITLPSSYTVAATGNLQNAEILKAIKQNKKYISTGQTQTWIFKQENVHDFAWFASKKFMPHYDTVMLPSKKIIDVFSFYKPLSKSWENSLEYAKDGLRFYSNLIGDYPYSTYCVVQGAPNINSEGMEYPTISYITIQTGGKELDATIVHEAGHNWFQGAIATNERDHPWMDEGLNSYYQHRYEQWKYKSLLTNAKAANKKFPDEDVSLLLAALIKTKKDQPISTESLDFTSLNYGAVVYYKTRLWLEKLEKDMGQSNFDAAMKHYYEQWKFKHPYPQNFKNIVLQHTNENLVNDNFAKLQTTGYLQPQQDKSLKPTLFFNLRNTDKYNYLSLSPALGYNHYDKIMVGGLVHNYQIPMNNFQFVAGTLYATGSKKLNGFASSSYTIYNKNHQLAFGAGFMNYGIDDFTFNNTTSHLRMKRFTPSVKLTLFDRDIHSTKRTELMWKGFAIQEDELGFETIQTPTDTFDLVTTNAAKTFINRFSVQISDNRKLFPYSIAFSADQGKEFIRCGITAKYFFNYSDNKNGMSLRFFAGKFFYLTQKTFLSRYNNDRYLLNLSAPKGNDDYTYSAYFAGRNEFEGWKSQQIMERDGFFKVNTELLSDKVGKTDNWLMALNLSSGLPDKYNPLSVLPLKIPLKLFMDIGTYAEAWKENSSTGRFVYDAGFQLSVFNNLVDIYVPLLYSKVYSNYYKSTITENRFLKTISFTINIEKLHLKELIPQLPL